MERGRGDGHFHLRDPHLAVWRSFREEIAAGDEQGQDEGGSGEEPKDGLRADDSVMHIGRDGGEGMGRREDGKELQVDLKVG